MTKVTTNKLVDLLRRSNLVDEAKLTAFLEKATATHSEAALEDQNRLAELLIAENLITRWQADKLLAGKHKGFRLGKYKLHVARYNSIAYNPAPPGGRVNLPLKSPELYDLIGDPDESYDVAAQHPEVVADIQARIERLMRGFPENIRKAYADTKAITTGTFATGAVPRL